MNSYVTKILGSSAIACMAFSAQAAVIDSANVGSLTTFQDTLTGRVWLDMNNFFDASASNGMTGNAMISMVQANGFQFAMRADVEGLLNSLPLDVGQWSTYAPIMGYSQPRQLIWGMYESGSTVSKGYAYAFSGVPGWEYNDQATDPYVVENATILGAQDMGIFAFKENVSAVPEPAENAMLFAGLGVIGTIFRRRRHTK